MHIKKDLLTINEFSRPSSKLLSVKKIVVHWVANPGTTAVQNRNFFELRKNGKHGYGSAHYILDDKEIIQCIPDSERAYHVGAKEYTDYGLSISSYPNSRTLGIEMCHPDDTGRPSYATYKHLIELLKYLCVKYSLNPIEDICTHHDITGKLCPKYYVEVPSEFYRLKCDVKNRISL